MFQRFDSAVIFAFSVANNAPERHHRSVIEITTWAAYVTGVRPAFLAGEADFNRVNCVMSRDFWDSFAFRKFRSRICNFSSFSDA